MMAEEIVREASPVLHDHELSYGARVLYCLMLERADRTGVCDASYADLATMMNLGTRSAVVPLLKALTDRGHVAALKPQGGTGRARYRLQPLHKGPVSPNMTPVESSVVFAKHEHHRSQNTNTGVRKTRTAVFVKREQARLPSSPVLSSRTGTSGTGSGPPVPSSTPVPPSSGKSTRHRTTSGAGNGAPNRIAQVIDAMTALGYASGTDYHLSGRDTGAIKSSTATPELLAQAYVDLKQGTWGDHYLHGRLSMHVVVENINAYLERGHATSPPGQRTQPARSAGQAHYPDGGGAVPSYLDGPPHVDYEF